MTVDNKLGYLGETRASVKSSSRVVPIIKISWDKLGQRKPSIYKVSQMPQLSQRTLVEYLLNEEYSLDLLTSDKTKVIVPLPPI